MTFFDLPGVKNQVLTKKLPEKPVSLFTLLNCSEPTVLLLFKLVFCSAPARKVNYGCYQMPAGLFCKGFK